jgi:competence ComEA-like helix-hairpin-helix protein
MKAMLASLCLSLLPCLVAGLPAVAHATAPQVAMLCAAPRLEGTVNLNTATKEQLMLLPGVGPATADKVLAYRKQRQFHRPAHIMRIKGIGKKTFAKLRPYLAVEGETTLHAAGSGS